MFNWLLQQIEKAKDEEDKYYEMNNISRANYWHGRANAFKECLKFIEDASRKEKENE